MAEAAVMDPQTGTFEASPPPSSPPPGKPKAGRPAGYKPFDNEQTSEDFFVMLNAIPEADWPKSLVYVWRRDPFTDNTNGGREPKYIDVINRAVTERNIKEEHGSGVYKLQLNTSDKYVTHTILSIEDINYPPHIPPGDWFNNPRNKKWQPWKPIVEKWWKEKLASISAPVPMSNDNAALGELSRLVSQLANQNGKSDGDALSKTLVAWALQQTADQKKAERDSDSPGKIAELIRAVKELMPAPAAPVEKKDDPMLGFLLAQLTRVQESNDKLIQMMLVQKNDTANPLSQVETMAKLITTVSGIVQPAAPKEPWVETIEHLGPGVISALDKFATGMVMTRNAPRPPQQPQGPRPFPQQAQFNPAQVVTVQPVAQSQPAGNEPPPPEVPAVATAAPGEPDMDTAQRSMIWQIAILAANALNLRMDGDQFADQICFAHGEAIYQQFITSVPKESLLGRFKAVPEAWQVLSPYEQVLPTFIDSFYAFATEADEDETKPISPEPVTVTVKTAKKTKKKG